MLKGNHTLDNAREIVDTELLRSSKEIYRSRSRLQTASVLDSPVYRIFSLLLFIRAPPACPPACYRICHMIPKYTRKSISHAHL